MRYGSFGLFIYLFTFFSFLRLSLPLFLSCSHFTDFFSKRALFLSACNLKIIFVRYWLFSRKIIFFWYVHESGWTNCARAKDGVWGNVFTSIGWVDGFREKGGKNRSATLRKISMWSEFSLGKLLNKTHRCVKFLYNSHKFLSLKHIERTLCATYCCVTTGALKMFIN